MYKSYLTNLLNKIKSLYSNSLVINESRSTKEVDIKPDYEITPDNMEAFICELDIVLQWFKDGTEIILLDNYSHKFEPNDILFYNTLFYRTIVWDKYACQIRVSERYSQSPNATFVVDNETAMKYLFNFAKMRCQQQALEKQEERILKIKQEDFKKQFSIDNVKNFMSVHLENS